MRAVDVAALAQLAAPRLCRVGLLPPASYYEDFMPRGSILRCMGAPCSAEPAVTALAMGLPRPVDAEGRPTGLRICIGCKAIGASTERDVKSELVEAGREWAVVVWPTII